MIGVPDGPVYLRALERADVELTHAWHNDPALYATLGSPFRLVSREAEQAWLERRTAYSQDEVNAVICRTSDGAAIGLASLRGIDHVARHAELSILIGASADRGQGFGTAAVELLVKHAFEDLGLQRVYLELLADNEPALALYRRCGFELEGRLRRHAFNKGKFVDVLVMGCLHEGEA